MFILNTNVVSELRNVRLGRAGPNVARRADSVDAEDMYVSAIVIQELEMGVLLAERRDAIQGAVPRAWLTDRGDRAGAWHDRNVADFAPMGGRLFDPGDASS